jgi:hypothetical protein
MSGRTTANVTIATYLQRFFLHPLSQGHIFPRADLYIVVPCYAEEQLEKLFDALSKCTHVPCSIVLILVVNSKANDPEDTQTLCSQNLDLARQYAVLPSGCQCFAIDARGLTDKNAGVGLARKIGMDAVLQQNLNWETDPGLVCLDADCTVSGNYLEALYDWWKSGHSVATLEFSHPVSEDLPPALREGILHYEWYLEYYRLGLASTGFPYYQHTVGSSMACRSLAYAKAGGMNQRQAGEDFYFLHKLFPHHSSLALNGPLVFPSPRISYRVPFGTGRFQSRWVGERIFEDGFRAYHPMIFHLMAIFLKDVRSLMENGIHNHLSFFPNAHPQAQVWLSQSGWEPAVVRILSGTASLETRMKAFFSWFDGLKALRFVHFFQNYFPDLSVAEIQEGLGGEKGLASLSEQTLAIRRFLYYFPATAKGEEIKITFFAP